MNIFRVLSQGYGRLDEENLSAMLGFLLAPYETHGIGDVFLRRFLEVVATKCGDPTCYTNVLKNPNRINAQIVFEEPYFVTGLKEQRRIDVEIRIFDDSSESVPREIHRIAVENKIRPSSAQEGQLKEEFVGIQSKVQAEGEAGSAITMVFLTPFSQYARLHAEFETLDNKTLGQAKKAWLYWHHDSDSSSVTQLIREILRQEADAAINPISDYMIHTLKAFVRHVSETMREPEKVDEYETGGLLEQVIVDVSTGKYRLERYQSSTIKAFNLTTQEYESAIQILKQVIAEKSLPIALNAESGGTKNTRQLGKEVISALQNPR